MNSYNIDMEIPHDYECEKTLSSTGSCLEAGSNVHIDVIDLFSSNGGNSLSNSKPECALTAIGTHTVRSQFKDADGLSVFLSKPSAAPLCSRILYAALLTADDVLNR
jgi:hypothetical protein